MNKCFGVRFFRFAIGDESAIQMELAAAAASEGHLLSTENFHVFRTKEDAQKASRQNPVELDLDRITTGLKQGKISRLA